MKPLTLRTLALLFFFAVLAALVSTAAGTLIATDAAIVDLVDRRITNESEEIASPGTSLVRSEVITRIDLASRRRDSGDIGFLLSDRQGRRLGGNVVLPRRFAEGFSDLTQKDGIEGLTRGRALVRDIGNDMILTTLAETEPIEHFRSARLKIILSGFTSIILIVIVGLILFGRQISRRVSAMRSTAEAVIEGDMKQRVPVDGSGSELDQQASTFNRMLDRIEALMTSISNVSHDIAHDLRTPLARMRAGLVLARREATGTHLQNRIDDALIEIDQVLEMFSAILRIAEVEGGRRRAGFDNFDLTEMCNDAAAIVEALIEEEGHFLLLEGYQTAWIFGDRRLLMQAVINLLENAVRYTPPGSTIQLSVRLGSDTVTICVADDGPGIPEHQRATAMRRFGRLAAARTLPGNGLGLSLVEAIARLHRGYVTLGDALPGLQVLLTLPLTSKPSEVETKSNTSVRQIAHR